MDANKPQQTITLRDGTIIQGNLVSVTGGSYTVENATMGKVNVPASQVVSINAAGAGSSAHSTPSAMTITPTGSMPTPQLNAMQKTLMQDPQIMASIQDMLKDPSVMELLKNPNLMQDALSMDPEKIKNNPDMQTLMQNPKMQEIFKAAAEKMQNSGNTPPTSP